MESEPKYSMGVKAFQQFIKETLIKNLPTPSNMHEIGSEQHGPFSQRTHILKSMLSSSSDTTYKCNSLETSFPDSVLDLDFPKLWGIVDVYIHTHTHTPLQQTCSNFCFNTSGFLLRLLEFMTENPCHCHSCYHFLCFWSRLSFLSYFFPSITCHFTLTLSFHTGVSVFFQHRYAIEPFLLSGIYTENGLITVSRIK